MHDDRYHLGRINHGASPDQSKGTETSFGVQFHNECKTKCLVNSILKKIYIKNPPFSGKIFSSPSVPLCANIEAGGSCYDNGFMYMKPLDERTLTMS
ncbi:ATP-dependent DNA helicase pif1 [Fusarium oxysporum f. sp. albedinis]|nr:ATP-dependent DNA helicase pif1 [Fusarium oxysporum f. sp. albedinis]